MNRQRDIDRVLDAWFVDGASGIPDRLFDAVLEEVGRMPQRRRPWSNLRVQPMSLQARVAAAAAVIVLIGGAGLAALNMRPADINVGGTASPSAAPTLPPVSADSRLPADLEFTFLGPLRANPPAPQGEDRSLIGFAEMEFRLNDRLLPSTATMPSVRHVRLVSTGVAGGCAVGDQGLYAWNSSLRWSRVTFTLVADECAARAAVVPGDWLRANCATEDNFCLGRLEPGSYASHYIDPSIPYDGAWKPRFGAITYDVPNGWENTADYPTTYFLQPWDASGHMGVFVHSEAVIMSADESCTELPEPGVGRTAEAMTTYLTSAEGIVATTPVATTIGGLAGWTFDISLDPSWTRSCPHAAGTPARALFTDPDRVDGGTSVVQQAGAPKRLWLLDLDDGRTLVIYATAANQAAWDEMLVEATPIVESMNFAR